MMLIRKVNKIWLAALLLIASKTVAQTDSAQSPLSFSGYVETYYAYDFGQPAHHNRPSFLYSHNRHNEVNLNLGLVKATYQNKGVRANLGLATGTYMNANYAPELGVMRHVFEANAGVKLSKRKDIWVDAGIFGSHIGFESAIGKDCWTLTRSLLAETSPYYETGVKVSYTSDNGKLFISGLLLNGWQRIQRIDGNNTLAGGHQLTFKPNAKITLNSSSFIGNDKPDSAKQMRYFHDFYGIFQLNSQWALTLGFDIGAEQRAKGSKRYHTWYSPTAIVKMNPDEKNSIAARLEYYNDPHGVIIPTGTPNGFKTWGYSLNYDRAIRNNIVWRMEARGFSAKDKTWEGKNGLTNTNFCITTALAIAF
jgi:Putative beta-barrel porin-2, OmpL-like. bbp2